MRERTRARRLCTARGAHVPRSYARPTRTRLPRACAQPQHAPEHARRARARDGGQTRAAEGTSTDRQLGVSGAAGSRAARRGPELASAVAHPAAASPARAAHTAVGVEADKQGVRLLAARLAEAFGGLSELLPPGTADALVLLAATALVVPILASLKLSPILGFLIAGCALGPNGLHLVRDVHTTEVLAELGVVFFLFEMGLELSIERLKALSRDAFGLGSTQFILTTLALAIGAEWAFRLPKAASLVIGASLALSSSAFVIQLLQERQELATRFGRASFGILLFQDIAVVPMLVLVPLLGTGGSGAALGTVLLTALLKAFAALSIIGGVGPIVLRRAYQGVTASKSQEAFVAITLLTVLSMSAFTKALGLSDTLGAFLAGVLLAESRYRYQIEADIAPFRGILFGLFFITIGYAIDLRHLAANWPQLCAMLVCLHVLKASLLVVLCKLGGLTSKASIRTGVLLSQAGEFAFVLFGLAQQHGVIDAQLAKLLLLCAALSMSATPFLADAGAHLAESWERRQRRLDADDSSNVLEPAHDSREGQVLVCGYGGVGTIVCDLLASMFVPYAACDIDPQVVAAAQERGLPVYFGDARRPDVLRAFGLLKVRQARSLAPAWSGGRAGCGAGGRARARATQPRRVAARRSMPLATPSASSPLRASALRSARARAPRAAERKGRGDCPGQAIRVSAHYQELEARLPGPSDLRQVDRG